MAYVDKKLLYDIDVGPIEYLTMGGVPEGSVLRQFFWNVMYAHLLGIKLLRQTTLIGYAVVDKYLENVVWSDETSVSLIKE